MDSLIRVLLIDDDEDEFILLSNLLPEANYIKYKFEWCSNYNDGLSSLIANDYDIYIIDYQIGILNGISLIKEAIKKGCTKGMILLTGLDTEGLDIEAMEAGASDFLDKNQVNAFLLERTIRYVVESKKAENILREREKRYELLAENISDVIFTLDLNFKFTYISPSATDLFGYTVDEAMQLSLNDILMPESFSLVLSLVDEEFIKEKTQGKERYKYRTIELLVKRKDNTPMWAEIRGSFLRDANDKPCGILGVLRDITERKSAEKLLKDKEEWFRALIEKASDGLAIIDKEGTFQYMAPSIKKILGYEPEEIIGINILDVIPKKSKENIQTILSYLKKGSVIEGPAYHKDGSTRWLEGTATIMIKDPKINGIILNFRDISERKRTEREIAEKERKFRTLIEASSDVIHIFDRNGKILYVSPSVKQVFGYTPEEVIGQSLFEYVHPDDTEIVISAWQAGINNFSENPTVAEFRCRRKDGSWRILESKGRNYLLSPGIDGIVSSSRDVTARKQVEDELRKHKDELEKIIEERTADLIKAKVQAETANIAKTEFIGNITHELKTPLNSILGHIRLLEMQSLDNLTEQQREFINVIKENGEHLLQLINEILDITKIESGKLEIEKTEFDIYEMLAKLFVSVKPIADTKRLHIDLNCDPDIGYITADKIKIKQVIYNLISNAIKFTASGKKTGIDAYGRNTDLIISIWDEGIGIDEKHFKKIFQPFQQVVEDRSAKSRGSGLGLAICKNIIEKHNGTITLESKTGSGSKFIVVLPGRRKIK